MNARVEELRRKFDAAGQGRVFRWWDDLDEDARGALIAQLEGIDLDWVSRAGEGLRNGTAGFHFSGELTPADYIHHPTTAEAQAAARQARALGEYLIRQGKVAALVVAGGQGTRLGFSAPKGCYPIAPVSGDTLFQIHAESILAISRGCDAAVPLCVMTSDATDQPTRDFFEENQYFGLRPEDVIFFRQGMLPALTPDGLLVLEEKGGLLMSPNGHGGTMAALCDEGVLDELESRGVEEISYFQVDNPLIRQVDPVFIGYHRQAAADMSNKAIPKRDPEEKLGAFGLVDGRLTVVEYSDLTPEQMRRRRPDGGLVFGLGSPAMHVFSVAFARRMGREGCLPWHVAEKSSAVVNEAGEVATPDAKNVRKFETFIFDALLEARNSIIMEVAREDEFSPVKNADGADSPATARRDMTERWARWMEAAGVAVSRDADGSVAENIEISPLIALDAEALADRIAAAPDIIGRLRHEWARGNMERTVH